MREEDGVWAGLGWAGHIHAVTLNSCVNPSPAKQTQAGETFI